MCVLVIGSSNTDFSLKVRSLPKPGETVLGNAFSVQGGGKGANQAVAAARLGCEVKFCCKVGSDNNGKTALDSYRKEGIDDSYFFVDKSERSGVALILVDENAENQIAVAPGTNSLLSPLDIDSIEPFSNFEVVLAQLEIPVETVEAICLRARKANVKMVLNPAPARKLSEEILGNIDILTPNETEAEILTGVKIENEDDAFKAAKILCDKGVGHVVITLGQKGAFICDGEKSELVPAFKVEAVDTTAAGDVFNGALCVALSEGEDIPSAVRFASAAAALAVTRNGAQDSAPARYEMDSFLKKQQ